MPCPSHPPWLDQVLDLIFANELARVGSAVLWTTWLQIVKLLGSSVITWIVEGFLTLKILLCEGVNGWSRDTELNTWGTSYVTADNSRPVAYFTLKVKRKWKDKDWSIRKCCLLMYNIHLFQYKPQFNKVFNVNSGNQGSPIIFNFNLYCWYLTGLTSWRVLSSVI
jgi:hypothetical protein